jgi:hypothetical protein
VQSTIDKLSGRVMCLAVPQKKKGRAGRPFF